MPAYWQTGYVEGENGLKNFLGEDIFFCRQWIAMGEKIWIDPQVNFRIVGHSIGRVISSNMPLKKALSKQLRRIHVRRNQSPLRERKESVHLCPVRPSGTNVSATSITIATAGRSVNLHSILGYCPGMR